MKIVLFDAGISNVHSISKGLARADETADITTDLGRLASADCLVLPGVGAFGAAAEALEPVRDKLRTAITGGLPTLGICLGMQLLFSYSTESPGEGLGVLTGEVAALPTRRRPHMGWNRVQPVPGAPTPGLRWAYFAHSYTCVPADPDHIWTSTTHDGTTFVSAVRSGRIWGAQFHPEKSSRQGVDFLRRFIEEAR